MFNKRWLPSSQSKMPRPCPAPSTHQPKLGSISSLMASLLVPLSAHDNTPTGHVSLLLGACTSQNLSLEASSGGHPSVLCPNAGSFSRHSLSPYLPTLLPFPTRSPSLRSQEPPHVNLLMWGVVCPPHPRLRVHSAHKQPETLWAFNQYLVGSLGLRGARFREKRTPWRYHAPWHKMPQCV